MRELAGKADGCLVCGLFYYFAQNAIDYTRTKCEMYPMPKLNPIFKNLTNKGLHLHFEMAVRLGWSDLVLAEIVEEAFFRNDPIEW